MSRRVIDADRHVSEPLGMWLEYLEPEFRPYAPRMRMADTPLPELTVDGLPLFANWGLEFQREASQQGRQHARELHKATSGAGQLESMDAAGISEAYVPSLATFLLNQRSSPPPSRRASPGPTIAGSSTTAPRTRPASTPSGW